MIYCIDDLKIIFVKKTLTIISFILLNEDSISSKFFGFSSATKVDGSYLVERMRCLKGGEISK
jgi:hypothetical protein